MSVRIEYINTEVLCLYHKSGDWVEKLICTTSVWMKLNTGDFHHEHGDRIK